MHFQEREDDWVVSVRGEGGVFRRSCWRKRLDFEEGGGYYTTGFQSKPGDPHDESIEYLIFRKIERMAILGVVSRRLNGFFIANTQRNLTLIEFLPFPAHVSRFCSNGMKTNYE